MKIYKRLFDIIFSLVALFFLVIPILIISILIKISSKGPLFFISKRVGFKNRIFNIPKFRTMKLDTPQKATHLLEDSDQYITPLGSMMRKFSVDEIPQLYSVLIGKMSLVGPRPALFNQTDLIKLRFDNSIHTLKPGITGWAQVNGRDELSIEDKVKFEKEYLEKNSLKFDLYIIWLTIAKIISREGVSH